MTCERVDQEELDRRYLNGQLSDAEAAAFEAHYFGCDRCWALVKAGAGVRAASKPDATVSAVRWPAWRKPLVIAAGLGIVAFGTWQALVSRDAAERDAMRGTADSLAVRTALSAGVWRAAWPADPAVASYRVRFFAADGRLLFTRQVPDTSLEVPADSLSALGVGAPLYLDVQGFDALQRPVTRSPLIPISAPVEPP
jgi:hypothetical protein